jgi:TatD DNase family protein
VAEWIDTHAHLDAEQLAGDLPDVLARALAAGVVRMVAVGICLASSHACRDLARRYPFLAASAGIHPNSAVEARPSDWDHILELARDPQVAGIGETGLDRHWDTTPFPLQEEYFARHLTLSRQTGKPIIIHCREADADVLGMLRQEYERHGPIRGVLHSFVGSQAMADEGLAMGLHLSFAGMLTYKNAAEVRAVAARVPLDRLLVETDCPYLAPVPHRGRRNEPAYVVATGTRLAEERGMPVEELAEATTRNARRLFGLGS